jgi:hypothetical protein
MCVSSFRHGIVAVTLPVRALAMEHLSLSLSLSLKRLSAEGLWGGLLYRGPPKDMLSKALEWTFVPKGARFWGTWRGALFLAPLRYTDISRDT